MQTRRWTNPSQPQTLQIAVFLLYMNAVFGLIFGTILSVYAGPLIGLLGLVASAAAGYGIANEKKWGYALGVGIAGIVLFVWASVILASSGLAGLFDLDNLIRLIFPAAQFALLVHPLSREYQRIWFS